MFIPGERAREARSCVVEAQRGRHVCDVGTGAHAGEGDAQAFLDSSFAASEGRIQHRGHPRLQLGMDAGGAV